jgi:hypothetical protein
VTPAVGRRHRSGTADLDLELGTGRGSGSSDRLDKQKKLQGELKPIELPTRQALTDAVAAELNEGARRRRVRPLPR